MPFAIRHEIIPGTMRDEPLPSEAATRSTNALRHVGWVAVAFFTLKGLLWLALGAGAWRLLQ